MAGRHRDTMIGASIDDIIVLEDPEPIWNAAHRQMTDAECTITSWSGTIIEAVVSTRSVIGVDGALYTVVFVRDMSERKRFEQQREWAMVPLLQPLEVGQMYYCSFRANAAFGGNAQYPTIWLASSNIGMLFTTYARHWYLGHA